MSQLSCARQLLQEHCEYTCVLVKHERVLTSKERGVKPLLDWLEQGTDLRGCSAADKVVGKASALLYVLLGASEVYAGVISESALEVLKHSGIRAEYGTMVPEIRNRTNTGRCPMEEAVLTIDDADQALNAIREKLRLLKAAKP